MYRAANSSGPSGTARGERIRDLETFGDGSKLDIFSTAKIKRKKITVEEDDEKQRNCQRTTSMAGVSEKDIPRWTWRRH